MRLCLLREQVAGLLIRALLDSVTAAAEDSRAPALAVSGSAKNKLRTRDFVVI